MMPRRETIWSWVTPDEDAEEEERQRALDLERERAEEDPLGLPTPVIDEVAPAPPAPPPPAPPPPAPPPPEPTELPSAPSEPGWEPFTAADLPPIEVADVTAEAEPGWEPFTEADLPDISPLTSPEAPDPMDLGGPVATEGLAAPAVDEPVEDAWAPFTEADLRADIDVAPEVVDPEITTPASLRTEFEVPADEPAEDPWRPFTATDLREEFGGELAAPAVPAIPEAVEPEVTTPETLREEFEAPELDVEPFIIDISTADDAGPWWEQLLTGIRRAGAQVKEGIGRGDESRRQRGIAAREEHRRSLQLSTQRAAPHVMKAMEHFESAREDDWGGDQLWSDTKGVWEIGLALLESVEPVQFAANVMAANIAHEGGFEGDHQRENKMANSLGLVLGILETIFTFKKQILLKGVLPLARQAPKVGRLSKKTLSAAARLGPAATKETLDIGKRMLDSIPNPSEAAQAISRNWGELARELGDAPGIVAKLDKPDIEVPIGSAVGTVASLVQEINRAGSEDRDVSPERLAVAAVVGFAGGAVLGGAVGSTLRMIRPLGRFARGVVDDVSVERVADPTWTGPPGTRAPRTKPPAEVPAGVPAAPAAGRAADDVPVERVVEPPTPRGEYDFEPPGEFDFAPPRETGRAVGEAADVAADAPAAGAAGEARELEEPIRAQYFRGLGFGANEAENLVSAAVNDAAGINLGALSDDFQVAANENMAGALRRAGALSDNSGLRDVADVGDAISAVDAERVNSALVVHVFGDAGKQMLSSMQAVSSDAPKIAAVREGIEQGLPALARAKARAAGTGTGADITQDVAEAVTEYARIQRLVRGGEYTRDMWIAEQQLHPLSGAQVALIKHLDEISATPGAIREFIEKYAEAVVRASTEAVMRGPAEAVVRASAGGRPLSVVELLNDVAGTQRALLKLDPIDFTTVENVFGSWAGLVDPNMWEGMSRKMQQDILWGSAKGVVRSQQEGLDALEAAARSGSADEIAAAAISDTPSTAPQAKGRVQDLRREVTDRASSGRPAAPAAAKVAAKVADAPPPGSLPASIEDGSASGRNMLGLEEGAEGGIAGNLKKKYWEDDDDTWEFVKEAVEASTDELGRITVKDAADIAAARRLSRSRPIEEWLKNLGAGRGRNALDSTNIRALALVISDVRYAKDSVGEQLLKLRKALDDQGVDPKTNDEYKKLAKEYLLRTTEANVLTRGLSGATAEAGRSLRALGKMAKVKPGREALEAKAYELVDGEKNPEKFEQFLFDVLELQRHADPNDPGRQLMQEYQLLQGLITPSLSQRLTAWRVMSMLSSPATHLLNIASNTFQSWARPVERLVAGKPREAVMDSYGMLVALLDGQNWRRLGRTIKSGIPEDQITGQALGSVAETKLDVLPHPTPFGKQWAWRFLDWPGRFLVAADVWAKDINRSGVLYAEAWNVAKGDRTEFRKIIGGESLNPEQFRRMAKRIEEDIVVKEGKRTAEQQVEDVIQAIAGRIEEAAKRATYTETRGLGGLGEGAGAAAKAVAKVEKSLLDLRRDPGPTGFIASVIQPFIRTHMNIAREGLSSLIGHSPQLLAAAKRYDAAKVSGDSAEILIRKREFALAAGKSVTATISTVMIFHWGTGGNITGRGPKDPAKRQMLRATGWRPYSVRLPRTNQWIGYSGIGPASVPLTLAGAVNDAMLAYQADRESGDLQPDDAAAIVQDGEAFLTGIKNGLIGISLDSAYLSGVEDVMNLLSGHGAGNRFQQFAANTLVRPFIPYSSALGYAEKVFEPEYTTRQIDIAALEGAPGGEFLENILARLAARIPSPVYTAGGLLGEPLPAARTPIGDVRKTDVTADGLSGRNLLPFQVSELGAEDPMLNELGYLILSGHAVSVGFPKGWNDFSQEDQELYMRELQGSRIKGALVSLMRTPAYQNNMENQNDDRNVRSINTIMRSRRRVALAAVRKARKMRGEE